MARTPVSAEQNIFFNSEQVDDLALTKEQEYNRTIQSGLINNHVGTGVLPETMNQNTLWDSDVYLSAYPGSLDGKPLVVEGITQPSDNVSGSQLEVSLINTKVYDRRSVKVCIIGLDVNNAITYETFTFRLNETQIGKIHFKVILNILMNDFVGDEAVSFNLKGNGKILVKEANSLAISRSALMDAQDVMPNLFWRDFFVDLTYGNLQSLLDAAAPGYDLYSTITIAEKGKKFLQANDVTSQVGQKFIAKTDNIQKITVLLSVDDLGYNANDYSWTGELVFNVFRLQSDVACSTDFIPELLIEFPPEASPLAQISVTYNSLLAQGIQLNTTPQPVDIVLSNTPIGSNLRGFVQANQYYLFSMKRSGDASINTIYVSYGDSISSDARTSSYDGNVWTDSPVDSLWYKVWTDAIKVVDGQFYDQGHGASIDKTIKNEQTLVTTDFSKDYIPFSKFQEQTVLVSATVEKTNQVQDQRTGSSVYSAQQMTATVSVISNLELSNNYSVSDPLVIGKIYEANTKSIAANDASVSFALTDWTFIDNVVYIPQTYIDGQVDPSFSSLEVQVLNNNLVGSKFRIASGFQDYRIGKAQVICHLLGDVNGDGIIDQSDVSNLYSYKDFSLTKTPALQSLFTTKTVAGQLYADTIQSSYGFHTTTVSANGNVAYYIVNKINQGGVSKQIIEQGFAALSVTDDNSKGLLVGKLLTDFSKLTFNDPNTIDQISVTGLTGLGNGNNGQGALISRDKFNDAGLLDMTGWQIDITSPQAAYGSYIVKSDDLTTAIELETLSGGAVLLDPFTAGAADAFKITYDAANVLIYIADAVAPNALTSDTNYGEYRITAFNTHAGVPTKSSEIIIQKSYLNEERMLEMIRADVNFDRSVTDQDVVLLQSFVDRNPDFFTGIANNQNGLALSPETGSIIGKPVKVVKLILEDFVDRMDDYPITTTRNSNNHRVIDIFTNELTLQNQSFVTPINLIVDKILTWEEYNILTSTENRFVPFALTVSGTTYCNQQCYSYNESSYLSVNTPTPRNAKVDVFVPNNLVIGNGQIIDTNGNLHKVDFEVAIITLDIPMQSTGGEVHLNLLQDFMAVSNSDPCSGKTALQYQALKFADGSYVDMNAINKDQLRLSVAIQSYFPDAICAGGVPQCKVPRLATSLDYETGNLTLNYGDLHYQDDSGKTRLAMDFQDLLYQIGVKTFINRVQVIAFIKKAGFNNKPVSIDSKQMENILSLLGQVTTPPVGDDTFRAAHDLSGSTSSQNVIAATGMPDGSFMMRDTVQAIRWDDTSNDVRIDFVNANKTEQASSMTIQAQSNELGTGGDTDIAAGDCLGDQPGDKGGDLLLRGGNKLGPTNTSYAAYLRLRGGLNPGGGADLLGGDGNPGGTLIVGGGKVVDLPTNTDPYISEGAKVVYGGGHTYNNSDVSRDLHLESGQEFLPTSSFKKSPATIDLITDGTTNHGASSKAVITAGDAVSLAGDWERFKGKIEIVSDSRNNPIPSPVSIKFSAGYGHTAPSIANGDVDYDPTTIIVGGGILNESAPTQSYAGNYKIVSGDFRYNSLLRSGGGALEVTGATYDKGSSLEFTGGQSYDKGGHVKFVAGAGRVQGGNFEIEAGSSFSSPYAAKITLIGNDGFGTGGEIRFEAASGGVTTNLLSLKDSTGNFDVGVSTPGKFSVNSGITQFFSDGDTTFATTAGGIDFSSFSDYEITAGGKFQANITGDMVVNCKKFDLVNTDTVSIGNPLKNHETHIYGSKIYIHDDLVFSGSMDLSNIGNLGATVGYINDFTAPRNAGYHKSVTSNDIVAIASKNVTYLTNTYLSLEKEYVIVETMNGSTAQRVEIQLPAPTGNWVPGTMFQVTVRRPSLADSNKITLYITDGASSYYDTVNAVIGQSLVVQIMWIAGEWRILNANAFTVSSAILVNGSPATGNSAATATGTYLQGVQSSGGGQSSTTGNVAITTQVATPSTTGQAFVFGSITVV